MATRQQTTRQIGYGFIAILLFWLLPVAVAVNYRGVARRFSFLPGVSDTGGAVSGVSMTVYILLALFIVVGLASVAIGGADDSQDSGGDATPTPGQDPTPDQTPTPEPEPTFTADDPESALATVYLYNDTAPVAGYSTLTLYNESGGVVATEELERSSGHQFEGLDPGTNYTVEATNVEDGQFPSVSQSFQPGQVDNIDLVTGYELQAANSYASEYSWNVSNVSGEYIGADEYRSGGYSRIGSEGQSYALRVTTLQKVENQKPFEALHLEESSFLNPVGNDSDWEEREDYTGLQPGGAFHRIIRHPDEYLDDERTYLRSEELGQPYFNDSGLADTTVFNPPRLDNRTIDIYEITIYDEDDPYLTYDHVNLDIEIGVDPDTGYVMYLNSDARVRDAEYLEEPLTSFAWNQDNVSELNPIEYIPASMVP